MDPTKVSSSLRSASGKVIGVGVVLSLVGIVFILAPQALGMGVSSLVGVLLIILGLLRIAFAWVASTWDRRFSDSSSVCWRLPAAS